MPIERLRKSLDQNQHRLTGRLARLESIEPLADRMSIWTGREYVLSAGPGSYVGEYVCEIASLNTAEAPRFRLLDANFNVLGLVDASGAVGRQHMFDACGRPLRSEDRVAAARSRVGHQGPLLPRPAERAARLKRPAVRGCSDRFWWHQANGESPDQASEASGSV